MQVTDQTRLLGFDSELKVGTAEEMKKAIMIGKCVHRDETASYYQLGNELFILSRKDIRNSLKL